MKKRLLIALIVTVLAGLLYAAHRVDLFGIAQGVHER
jgi:hypothetical protein